MAREDCSERGLPSAEVRRQILQHAGTILDKARDLLAWLDQQEGFCPTGLCNYEYSPERMVKEAYRDPVKAFHNNRPGAGTPASLLDQVLAA